MNESKSKRAGGLMVRLDEDTKKHVEAFRQDFESEFPGIQCSINEALAMLVNHGLEHVSSGPFVKVSALPAEEPNEG